MNHHHAEWLSLLEISGPFLSPSVLGRVFPQGLETVDVDLRRELRAVYDEWLDNQQGLRPDPAIHRTWIEWVLGDLLGLDDEVLFANQRLTDGISPNQWVGPPLVSMTDQSVTLRKHAITLRPDYIVRDDIAQDATIPRLLIQAVPMDQATAQRPPSAWSNFCAARV
ncbi:hypothetical protein KFU94_12435 [Chloroflexi bacterium TSY]|nr:hypothetical protein [Chloroflexi bacterium TSY]